MAEREQVEAAEKKVLVVYPDACLLGTRHGKVAIYSSELGDLLSDYKYLGTSEKRVSDAWIEAASRLPTPVEPKAQVESASVEPQNKQLFLDCDGVLADFDIYAEKIFGLPPRQAEEKLGSKRFWVDLQAHPDFYYSLPLMPGAKELYAAVKHLDPIILTGLPLGDWAEPQKRRWAEKHFPGVRVICCASKDKRQHMKPGDVLVDDWPKYRHLWEEAGGVFILHKSAGESIDSLSQLFPLEPKEVESGEGLPPEGYGACSMADAQEAEQYAVAYVCEVGVSRETMIDALSTLRSQVVTYGGRAQKAEAQLKASLLREKELRAFVVLCEEKSDQRLQGQYTNEQILGMLLKEARNLMLKHSIDAAVTGE